MRPRIVRLVALVALALAVSSCGGAGTTAPAPAHGETVSPPASNGADPWPAGTVRRWSGRWTGLGWAYDAVLTLRNEGGRVVGEIAWTLVRPAPGDMATFGGRVGHSAVETVFGTWTPGESRIDLQGTAVSDPTLISTDTYLLLVGADGSFSGRTITNDMDWSGVLVGRPL